MNRMMADGKVRRIELADGTRITVAAPKGPPRSEQLRGLDGAATAGFILQHLANLPEQQQLALMGESMPSVLPCTCKSPCCAGTKPNPTWARIVSRMCHHLAVEAQLSKIKGKKGLSTSPLLRSMLVEKHFLPRKTMILAAIAERIGVTEKTVIEHRRPIVDYLTKQADAGWRTFDVWLSEAGIVGAIL